MKEKGITLLVYKVGEPPEVKVIPNELQHFQDIVGGYIETVGLGNGIIAVVNEEGLIYNLPKNRMFVGNFFICKSCPPEFGSLTEAEIELIKKQIR